MNPLAIIRKHSTTWASTALSVFMLAWLSMLVAPCVMATDAPTNHMMMESQSHHANEMDTHADHDVDHDHSDHATSGHMDSASNSSHDCPRCPQDDNKEHCDVSDLNCSSLDNYDNRINKTKLKTNLQNNTLDDLESFPVVLVNTSTVAISPLSDPYRCISQPRKPLSGGTPLNVLYCVYLI